MATERATATWVREPGEYGIEEIEDLVRSGLDHSWMQFHQGRDVAAAGGERIMVKGEGVYLWDIYGNRYIDGSGGLLLMNIGHGREEVVDAIAAQLRALAYANTGSYATVPAILLAERVAAKAPGDLSKVFYCNGGSEAVEIALKMARQIQYLRGFPKKTKIVARRGQYHGSTYAAMSLTGRKEYKGIFEPLMPQVCHVEPPYCYRCPWGLNDGSVVAAGANPGAGCCMQAVRDFERLIEFEGADTIAAFIATPANVGNQLPPDGYWPAMRALCDQHDILLIADEIICGFGRMGRWFGMERFGIVPDLMTIAKALTGGYLPCGAVVARAEWADLFNEEDNTFHHGVTYGGHPGVMAAGMATLDIMERENLVENADRMGTYLYEQALERLSGHPSVGFVGGGIGLLLQIELVKNRQTKEKFSATHKREYGKALTEKLRTRGLATRAGDVISLSPPLTIDAPTIDMVLDIIDDALTEQEREYPSA
jgi:adenosylmethionine-8-amino-7-oxononanoate aminotransferase